MKKTLYSFFTQQSIPHRCIQHHLSRLSDDEFEVQTVQVYGRLFDFTARTNPKNVFMSITDYTQEVHDWVNDYASKVNIFLLMDKSLSEKNQELWQFLCQSPIKIIANTNVVKNIPPAYLTYENKYDDTVFTNQNKERNDKIAVMSNGNDEDKKRVTDLLYPNTKLKLIVFNDAAWETPQNLGMLDPVQLNKVLNTYDSFVDLTDNLHLEAQACGIKNIDISGDLKESIENAKVVADIPKLDKRTYSYFTEHEVLPYMRKNT